MAGKHGGRRSGAGRKKGVPNKINADLKAMILGALNALDGQQYLEKVARKDPRTFCALLGRVLPMTVAGDPNNPVGHTIQIVTGVPNAADQPAPVTNGHAHPH